MKYRVIVRPPYTDNEDRNVIEYVGEKEFKFRIECNFEKFKLEDILHSVLCNSNYRCEVYEGYKKRGWQILSLEEALEKLWNLRFYGKVEKKVYTIEKHIVGILLLHPDIKVESIWTHCYYEGRTNTFIKLKCDTSDLKPNVETIKERLQGILEEPVYTGENNTLYIRKNYFVEVSNVEPFCTHLIFNEIIDKETTKIETVEL